VARGGRRGFGHGGGTRRRGTRGLGPERRARAHREPLYHATGVTLRAASVTATVTDASLPRSGLVWVTVPSRPSGRTTTSPTLASEPLLYVAMCVALRGERWGRWKRTACGAPQRPTRADAHPSAECLTSRANLHPAASAPGRSLPLLLRPRV